MSIASEIERIKKAKADIKTSIENKGVSVDEALIDTYSSKIDKIEGKYKPSYISFTNYNGTDLTYEIEHLDISNMSSLSNLFQNCAKISKYDLSKFNTSHINSMSGMFYGNSSLTDLDVSNFDTSNVADFSYMFNSCRGLTSLDLSNFDFGKATNINSFIYQCSKLVDLSFGSNLGKGYMSTIANYSNFKLDLRQCNKLSHDSLMNVINKIYDLHLTYQNVGNGTLYTQTLTLGSTNKAKLTDDEIAIATAKGWTVS